MADYFVHKTSFIDEDVQIGAGTKIWHFSHLLKISKIGKNCSLGQNFCGPPMVFTNDLTPGAKYPKGSVGYKKTILREGSTIGANVTIVCGHDVGKWAMITAGAVVTKDVPAYALMAGCVNVVSGSMINWNVTIVVERTNGAQVTK